MRARTLVAIAHGSREPAAQRTVEALLDQVCGRLDGVPVRAAYVQNAYPSLGDALDGAGAGAVVVPLLLSRGYHAAEDVERVANLSGAVVSRPLGPDDALCDALLARLAAAGAPADAPIVLAAAGSSDPRAAADVADQAARLADRAGTAVVPAYVSGAPPTVAEAIHDIQARTGSAPAVAAYLVTGGHMHERLRRSSAAWVSAPLGACPELASLVVHRYCQLVTTQASA